MKLVQPVDGSYELLGRLLEYRQGSVKVGMEGREPIWIPLSQIKKARLELEKIADKKKE
jgi:ribosome maturation factor RimP